MWYLIVLTIFSVSVITELYTPLIDLPSLYFHSGSMLGPIFRVNQVITI